MRGAGSDVAWRSLFAALFVVRPHSNDLDRSDVFQNLVHESVLDIDASGASASQIPDKSFVRRGILAWIQLQNLKQTLSLEL
jgi:hypothetical protein